MSHRIIRLFGFTIAKIADRTIGLVGEGIPGKLEASYFLIAQEGCSQRLAGRKPPMRGFSAVHLCNEDNCEGEQWDGDENAKAFVDCLHRVTWLCYEHQGTSTDRVK